ncbi:hypothetical protein 10S7_14 [uncultured Caudovirales phage]|uniref:Uncharacterized protein n=1 Tax=uncultured Caudovirales phage TaxID=2100421 RepID=A0A2H4JHL7_9CAUD|nr:hypothetical protein 10S7_14 [uncultured Caudovirales phage]
MAVKKQPKKKRLINKEKAFNAKIKKEMQEEGILPPDKPKLNRKKFGRETWAEFNEVCGNFEGLMDLREAIGCMVSPDPRRVTSEEVGVYKLMKIAIETRKFKNRLKEEGRTQYTIGELADVIAPILKL